MMGIVKTLIALIGLAAMGYVAWPAIIDRADENGREGAIPTPTRSGFDAAEDRDQEAGSGNGSIDGSARESEEEGTGSPDWLAEGGSGTEASGDLSSAGTKKLTSTKASSPKPATVPVEDSVDLPVPFVAQAPKGVWEQPYQDACEEAAVIMVERFLRSRGLTIAEMDSEILKMVDWQTEKYGLYKDTNSRETAQMANDYFGLSSRAVYDVTAKDIRDSLRQGQPVIVLVDGRKLSNPYYTPPGPDKHALVITGLAGDEFITNDPGTRRGHGYRYEAATLMGAMVDYDGREEGTGGKAMIVFGKKE